ncbi:MAG: hypothetical protein RIC15_07670 [Vicingaceae bacterium]
MLSDLKNIKVLALALVISGFAGFLIKFAFEEVMYKHRDLSVEITVTSAKEMELIVSINKVPGQYGVVPFKFNIGANEKVKCNIPLPANEAIKMLMVLSRPESADFHIKGLRVNGFYREISWAPSELEGNVISKSIGIEKLPNFKILKNTMHVNLSNESPILIFNETWADALYGFIGRDSKWLGLVLGLIAFVLLIFYRKSWLSWAYQLPAYPLLLSSVFIAFLLIPFFSEKELESSENRSLAPMPSLNQLIWSIPNKYNKYFDDHFPFRNQLANINNILHLRIFKTSPLPDHLRIGKEDWLYIYVKPVRYAYRGDSLFSDEQLDIIKRNLEEKAAYLKMHGSDFYFIMPPLKHTVYPEYLPQSLSKKGRMNKREQLMAFLKKESSINLIDPLDMLVARKDSVRLYYKTDSHWNQLGAFFTYQMIMERIGKDHPGSKPLSIDQYNIKRSKVYTGDLLALINLHTMYYREPYHLSPKFPVHTEVLMRFGTVGSEVSYVAYANQDSTLPRLLMVRDSYADYLRNHLSNHFSYSGFSWTKVLEPERVKNDKPDIVVFEMMERFINHLLRENSEEIKKEVRGDQP